MQYDIYYNLAYMTEYSHTHVADTSSQMTVCNKCHVCYSNSYLDLQSMLSDTWSLMNQLALRTIEVRVRTHSHLIE